jgi:preprotein translocase subunit Sec63
VTWLTILLLPISYTILRRMITTFVKLAAWSCCKPSRRTLHFSRKRTRRLCQTSVFYLQCALLAGGWFLTAQYFHQAHLNRHLIQVWNPYHILGVSSRSSISQIKHAYKKQCIASHPDKRRRKAKAEAEVAFIEITKAYKVYQPSFVFIMAADMY